MSDPDNKPVIPDNDGTFNHQEAQRADEPATKQLLPPAKFEDLSEPMQAAFQRAGWTEMMPVQAITIPYILERRDLMVQSRTGSGKTGAYLLPVFERVESNRPHVQALVLVPTRELALQVTKEAEMLIGGSGLRAVAVYGGVGYGPQLDAFRQGAQIVIGTPGRILDHLLRRSMTLDNLRILVFDEADRMLSMGFYPDMVRVKSFLPRRRINSYMFSATYPPTVVRLSHQFLKDPEFLNLSSDHVHVTDTEHIYYVVPGMEKDRSLIRIIEIENPSSALIFCNTRARVHYVSVVLQRFGYDADELSADLSQAEREKVLKRVRKGTLRFLVATDVAARGIDIPELSHVFLYEPPEDQESYIHRAGRTGRAGASGVAISLVNALEKGDLQRIGRIYKIDFQERPLPSEEDMQAIVAERAVALLEADLRQRDRLKIERMERFVSLAGSMSESETGRTLLAMLLDDYYQQNFQPPVVEEEPDIPLPDQKDQAEGDRKRSGRKRSGSRRRGDRNKKDK
jgi:ATP-dependent RNA helicase DeaD